MDHEEEEDSMQTSVDRNKRLQKKRECEQARLACINSDPELKAKQKEKEHLKYLAKKQKGIVKSIDDLPPREQRKKRRSWKANSKRYRQNIRMI